MTTAADAGEWRSSMLLGILARDGRNGPVDRKTALLHFQIAVLEGGDQAEYLLRHDMEKLRTGLEAEELASIRSEASAWYEQHPVAQKFLVKDPNGAKYFPVTSNAELIQEALAAH